MKKHTLFLVVSVFFLLLSSLLMIGLTYGWFAKAVVVPKGEYSSGDITYTMTGQLVDDSIIIVPGFELIEEEYILTNLSGIESQLRIRIAYWAYVRVGLDVIAQELSYTNTSADFIAVVLGPNFERTGDYWYYTDDPLIDGPEFVLPPESGEIELLSSIIYDGTLTGIDFASQSIYLKIIVEVKQANNVSWSELTTIDFQTGT